MEEDHREEQGEQGGGHGLVPERAPWPHRRVESWRRSRAAQPGDITVGVMVSGTEARLDVTIGVNCFTTLLAKELLPLDRGGAGPIGASDSASAMQRFQGALWTPENIGSRPDPIKYKPN
jgi:hypothetical protein